MADDWYSTTAHSGQPLSLRHRTFVGLTYVGKMVLTFVHSLSSDYAFYGLTEMVAVPVPVVSCRPTLSVIVRVTG